MTELLLRWFVRAKTGEARHSAVGRLAGTVGILCNCLLFGLKLLAGLLSGAVSVVADALNNLSDAASSIVTLLGFQLARRPADQDHPYGHARYEYISGLVIAALILVIGVELGERSIGKILHPTPVDVSGITLVILVFSVALKLWMSGFFRNLGKKISSGALLAAAVDSRNDVIATAAVLAGAAVERLLHIRVDGYIGLGVAAFILYSGVTVARETVSPLLGQKADQQLVGQISGCILNHPKVLGIHDLLVHDYGPGQCFASVHVEISAGEDPLSCHDMIDAIECDVLERLNVHLVIHYDPVLDNDAEWAQLRQLTEHIITQIDPSLSMHDFRIVRGAEQPKLVFDLAVPYGMNLDHKQLRCRVEEALRNNGKDYSAVIRFDMA